METQQKRYDVEVTRQDGSDDVIVVYAYTSSSARRKVSQDSDVAEILSVVLS